MTDKCECNNRPFFPGVLRSNTETANGLERCVSFMPGFRCIVKGGNSHGIGSMDILFAVLGPNGS